jgi:hypothetical protein
MQNDFFVEISKSNEGDTMLIQTLFQFTKKINSMSPDELIAFFQALKMLKDMHPKSLFRSNKIRKNITNTQIIVVEAMQRQARNSLATARMFNNVISDVWIGWNQYHISA